ncbi:cupin domain-containing protein [Microvirga sp. 2YAF29]|uniref:cupin domain-containing protein n=1 Tax=Microvirga sp. 2YAF29 TaxID=3233031 RepID=UPI003F9AD1B2
MQSKLLAAACGLSFLSLLGPTFAQEQPHAMVNPGDIAWKEGPPSLPKGSQMSVLYGDPTKDGIFVMRLKFPANYKIPPHTHSVDEIVTVVSGEIKFGMGPQFDAAKTKTLTAGAVAAMPPGMQHYVQTNKEAVVQLSTRGPWSIAYVNPADDPRKSQ